MQHLYFYLKLIFSTFLGCTCAVLCFTEIGEEIDEKMSKVKDMRSTYGCKHALVFVFLVADMEGLISYDAVYRYGSNSGNFQ